LTAIPPLFLVLYATLAQKNGSISAIYNGVRLNIQEGFHEQ